MRILRNVFLSIQNIFHVFENKLNILRARTTARCCQGLESMKFLFNFGEKIVSIIYQHDSLILIRAFVKTSTWLDVLSIYSIELKKGRINLYVIIVFSFPSNNCTYKFLESLFSLEKNNTYK